MAPAHFEPRSPAISCNLVPFFSFFFTNHFLTVSHRLQLCLRSKSLLQVTAFPFNAQNRVTCNDLWQLWQSFQFQEMYTTDCIYTLGSVTVLPRTEQWWRECNSREVQRQSRDWMVSNAFAGPHRVWKHSWAFSVWRILISCHLSLSFPTCNPGILEIFILCQHYHPFNPYPIKNTPTLLFLHSILILCSSVQYTACQLILKLQFSPFHPLRFTLFTKSNKETLMCRRNLSTALITKQNILSYMVQRRHALWNRERGQRVTLLSNHIYIQYSLQLPES